MCYIGSFSNLRGENWGRNIEIALTEMGNIQGLIVDVRNNDGGNDRNAKDIAGRFTNERRLYRHVQWRNGPDHSDFTSFRGRLLLNPKAISHLPDQSPYSSTVAFLAQQNPLCL